MYRVSAPFTIRWCAVFCLVGFLALTSHSQDITVEIGGQWTTPGDSVFLPITLRNPHGHDIDEFAFRIDFLEYMSPLLPMTFDVLPTPMNPSCGWENFSYEISSAQVVIHGKAVGDPESNCLLDSSTVLAYLVFTIPFEMEYASYSTWIAFSWENCTDNTLSTTAHDTVFCSDSVYFPWTDTLSGPGAADSCLLPSPANATRDVEFVNGFLANGIAPNGDVNLNGVPFELGDLVIVEDYFIHGPSAFKNDTAAALFYSNVNCDRAFPSVADLVYMLRVVTGDAPPTDCTEISDLRAPYNARLYNDTSANKVTMLTSADSIAAVYLQFDGEITPQLVTAGPMLNYSYDGQITRVLVGPDSVLLGASKLIIPHGGLLEYTGAGNLIHADVADWTGLYEVPTHVYVTSDCCVGSTGNVNNDPNDDVDLADVTLLVDHLFLSFNPLPCLWEAEMDVGQLGEIDIVDLTTLVNHLFVTFEPLPDCATLRKRR